MDTGIKDNVQDMYKYFTKALYDDIASLKHEMRVLSMKLHPDRPEGDAEKFKEMIAEFQKIEAELNDSGSFRNMEGEEVEVEYDEDMFKSSFRQSERPSGFRTGSRPSGFAGRTYERTASASEDSGSKVEYDAPRTGAFVVRAKEIVFSRTFFKAMVSVLILSSYYSIAFAIAALGMSLIAKEWKLSSVVAFATFVSMMFFHIGAFVTITEALALKSVDMIILATVLVPFALFAKSYAFKKY